jgi:peptidoglycan-N-acetylmuramic acid deacetylase
MNASRHLLSLFLLLALGGQAQAQAEFQNKNEAREPVQIQAQGSRSPSTPKCSPEQAIYLTFDTGHMGVAHWVAEVLKRQQVKATFFLANERTLSNGASLDAQWQPWWQARAAEGHSFGSHTWDHVYWRADGAAIGPGDRDTGGGLVNGFVVRPTAGVQALQTHHLSAPEYCEQLRRPAERFAVMTGQTMLPLFRAPGGKTSPALLAAAKQCGFAHVPWSAAGFLGDELPSEKFSNAALLAKALRDIRAGDILLAHLGIWSRRDPWAPAVLEPLIVGLKQRGLCFASLQDHPQYQAWLQRSTPQQPNPPH